MSLRLSRAEEAAINRIPVPRIESGVSNADLETLAVLAFRAGRDFQRGQTTRVERDELSSIIKSTAEEARLAERHFRVEDARTLREIADRLDER